MTAAGGCRCAKHAYHSLADARRAQADGEHRDGHPIRIYRCRFASRTWHITSMAPRGRRVDDTPETWADAD